MSGAFFAQLGEMAALSQKAAVQTLGVVGDDTAIACNLLIGGERSRKLPMVWDVFKGSLRNKLILIPAALGLTFTMPGLIVPAMTLGGAILCYDSMEKIVHRKMKPPPPNSDEAHAPDHAGWEKNHVKKAIRTDLLLSAEITTVSLWTVAGLPFFVQLGTLAATGFVMTGAVYATVAGVIKLDDIGRTLANKAGDSGFSKAVRAAGRGIERIAPKLVKAIGVIGAGAMFLVGGTMVAHGIPGGDHLAGLALGALSSNALVQGVASLAINGAVGIAAGLAALPVAKVLLPPMRKTVALVKMRWKKMAKANLQPMSRRLPAPLPPEPANSNFAALPDAKAAFSAAVQTQQALQPVPVAAPVVKPPKAAI
ncbi:MAG TPA: DUF808 family protein [Patescibacteria group bacterium]|nr:DUF808 family protein [Patescibacteria group bacterium]